MSFPRETPYNDLPALPPGPEIETRAVLKRLVTARTALEGLRASGHLIPNPDGLVRALVAQEARQSSEIENIVTTNDALYRALSREQAADPHTKEVLRYTHALWQGVSLLKQRVPLGPKQYEALAETLLESGVTVRARPGTQIRNARTGEVVYTPPMGAARITAMLENLAEFVGARGDLDPLVRVAVGHYQFEAIHPFPDGNGRTGRVLNILWLMQAGLLDQPVLYLSRAIIADKARYYTLLRRVTEEADWEAWIVAFLEMVEVTALETRRRMEAISVALGEAKVKIRTRLPKLRAPSELAELVFSQPYTRVEAVVKAGIAQRQTAPVYLRDLARIGVLSEMTEGKELMFLNPTLLEILEA